MKTTKFQIPIYSASVTLYLDKDLKHIEQKYKTSCLDDFGAVTLRSPKNPYKDYIIAFEYTDGSIIAHEIVHLINYLFLDVGVELDRVNDETQAYLTGFLFEKIEEFLSKSR